MYSISCCGIPELLTSFFLRAKLTHLPPVQYEIFKVQVWVCDGYVLAGMAPSGMERKMQTPVKP